MDATNVSRRPRGRPPSRSWAFFTSLLEPQKLISAECRHCHQPVHYHKKWAQARAHLMKCPQFLQLIDTLPPDDVPPWYLAEMDRRQHKFVPFRGPPVYQQNQMVPSPLATATPFKIIQPMAMAMATGMPLQNPGEPVSCGIKDWATINENVAMHVFTTMQVEKLLEDTFEMPFLWQAFHLVAGTNVALCTKDELMTDLLDQCYNRVKAQVLGFLQSGLVPVALSLNLVASHEGSHSLKSMATLASSERYPLLLDSFQVPHGGTNSKLIVQHVHQLVESLSCPVAGCVVPFAFQSQETRQLLQTEFPAMYFYGCMRHALQSLLTHLFSATPDEQHTFPVPFRHDLQQFALQCKDLVDLLPPQEKNQFLNGVHTDIGHIVLVPPTRRFTIDEGYAAILQAEAFLNSDHVSISQIPSSTVESCDDCPTQILSVVQSPLFVSKLRKYLAILRPIHTSLSSLETSSTSTTSSLLLSEVYTAFSTLTQQLDASEEWTLNDKTAVHALVRHHQDHVLGSAHLLAYLLDPVLLAADLPADQKTHVEHQLVASRRGDGTSLSETETQALYAQYLAFKKSAWQQKRHKADTLAFRALKERKKSPLQFWFADGSKWPLVQAIACRIFVLPVCAASPAHVAVECGIPFRTDQDTTARDTMDKLRFVRVNARQVQRAEAAGSSLAALVKRPPVESRVDEITASMVV